jgi:hypothetical protein
MTALPARMIQASPPALSDLVLEYRGALLHSRVEDRPTSRRGLVPRAVLPAVIRDLQLALRPASENELRMAVARLTTSYPTARPPSPEGYILALLEELSGYPADVVIAAVREVRRTVKFLPAVAEVVEAAEKHVRDRRRMLFAARAMVEAHSYCDKEEAFRAQLEQERRARVARETGVKE